MLSRNIHAFSLLICVTLTTTAFAGDWPMWRFGPDRGAATAEALPAKLHLQWALALPTAQPAWPVDQKKLQFDLASEPVIAGGRVFVPSTLWNSVTAYDLATGEEAWRFSTNGPVRFAPCCAGDRVYVASDDGYLYCLNQSDGKLQWKFRGGPSDRRVIGNHRLTSTWPARGAPVVKDDVLYFAAGIWPFMGTFLHALDAKTGEVVWTNSGSGSNYLVQPHGSPAFAGVSPQGYLAVNETRLIVPGGRGVPAGYDRATGEFLFCDVGGYGKASGGYDVMLGKHWFACRGLLCSVDSGVGAGSANFVIKSQQHLLRQQGDDLIAFPAEPKSEVSTKRDRRGKEQTRRTFDLSPLWKAELPDEMRQVKIQAGNRLYGTDGASRVVAVDLPTKSGEPAKLSWQGEIAGTVWNMLAADGHLLVVSREGPIFCFGSEPREVDLSHLPQATNQQVVSDDGNATLISLGAVWKYLDNDEFQQNWQNADFDDSAWKSGPAELGYGDGDEKTVVSYGKFSRDKHITTWFRHHFELPEDAEVASLQMAAKIDDGAAVYLNGEEVSRINLPDGKIDRLTQATQTQDEKKLVHRSLSIESLKPGKNVLAVEIHQRNGQSSDISFDLELTAKLVTQDVPQKEDSPSQPPSPAEDTLAAAILSATKTREGYVTVLGADHEKLVDELAQHEKLQILVIEPDAKAADVERRRLQALGLLGRKVSVLAGEDELGDLPPYLNSLTIGSIDPRFGLLDAKGQRLSQVYRSLRPYGGSLVIPAGKTQLEQVKSAADGLKLEKAQWKVSGRLGMLTRAGALVDSAPWTHHNADVANSLISRDRRVKLPLGLLWFGGPSNQDVLPRHGHGPTPQVVGGRLYIEGPDMLRAVDVYTGRLLWQRSLPNLGQYYDNTSHHPGASAIGGNYVSTEDGIYVAYGKKCLWLDPATGETLREFSLPKTSDGEVPYWGYIGVYNDLLIAGTSPIVPFTSSRGVNKDGIQSPYAEGSAKLTVLDRKTGEVKWERDAQFNFRHNGIAAGAGLIYCLDRLTDSRLAILRRRGVSPEGKPQLLALDATSGKVVWSTSDNVFGTWLSFSQEHGLLLQATSKFRDRARDEETGGLVAYDAATGDVRWQTESGYGGPILLHDRMVITQGNAFDILSGKESQREHPVTGQPERWNFARNYGCNTVIGCTNLLTFRSAAAGFFDLAGDGGTGNFGGFRASCTSNLVPADGVLNAPDYTRTCTCSYQLQSSLALVHMPEAEVWTFQSMAWDGKAVQRLGINFGAPGDRRGPDGTLWVDYPSVGGRSPDVPVQVDGENLQYVRSHASQAGVQSLPWVASSGVRGAESVEITLASDSNVRPGKYQVRLIFAPQSKSSEGDASKIHVELQGQRVLSDFAPPRAASDKPVDTSVTIPNVAAEKTIRIELVSADEKSDEVPQVILAGVQIVREQE